MSGSGQIKKLFPCYYSFFVNGAIVLLVGSIMPYLIEEANISYSVAGSFISAFAIGNFLASFVNPVISARLGKKLSIVILSALLPICFAVISTVPSSAIICAMFVLAGIGRGSCSIINNGVVSDNTGGKAMPINILHMVFAIGALLSPFVTSLIIKAGMGWKTAVYLACVLSALSVLGYALMKNESYVTVEKAKEKGSKEFLKSPVFYISGLILFFYLGVENCVNGWFVTYFKSIEIMDEFYASSLVSITWLAVMLGRLLSAYLSTRVSRKILILVNCIASAVFFFMMVFIQQLTVITISIAGLGFFLAGIYPNCIANAAKTVEGSTTGMSVLLAIAALGGIVTPQVVGFVADTSAGFTGAILVLVVNIVGMIGFSIVNVLRKSSV